MRNKLLSALLLSTISFAPLAAQTNTPAVQPTEISAELGTCSALITVTGTDSKPIYNAKVSTRVHYGTFGLKKLDLETFTSANGQVKIVRLPEVPKKPIYIYVTKDANWASIEFQPDVKCHATFDVQLK